MSVCACERVCVLYVCVCCAPPSRLSSSVTRIITPRSVMKGGHYGAVTRSDPVVYSWEEIAALYAHTGEDPSDGKKTKKLRKKEQSIVDMCGVISRETWQWHTGAVGCSMCVFSFDSCGVSDWHARVAWRVGFQGATRGLCWVYWAIPSLNDHWCLYLSKQGGKVLKRTPCCVSTGRSCILKRTKSVG